MSNEFDPSTLNAHQTAMLARMNEEQKEAWEELSDGEKVEIMAMQTGQGFVSPHIAPDRPLMPKPGPKHICSRVAILRIRDASPYPAWWKDAAIPPEHVSGADQMFFVDPDANSDLNDLANLIDAQCKTPTSPEDKSEIADLLAIDSLPILAEVVMTMLQSGTLKGFMRHENGALVQVRPSVLGRRDVFDSLVTNREIEAPTERPKDPDRLFKRHGFGTKNGGLDLKRRVWFYAAEVEAAIQDFFYPPEQGKAVNAEPAPQATTPQTVAPSAGPEHKIEPENVPTPQNRINGKREKLAPFIRTVFKARVAAKLGRYSKLPGMCEDVRKALPDEFSEIDDRTIRRAAEKDEAWEHVSPLTLRIRNRPMGLS